MIQTIIVEELLLKTIILSIILYIEIFIEIFDFQPNLWANIKTNTIPIKSFEHLNFYKNISSKRHSFSLEKIVELTLVQGFDAREKAEKVYQARKFVNNKIGFLLPYVNLGSIGGIVYGNIFDVIPSFVGFLFPNKWFEWNESKMFSKAEEYSYRTLLGNQINMIQSLYFMIHFNWVNKEIISHYHKLTDQLLNYFSIEELKLKKNITGEQIGFLRNLNARLSYKKSVLVSTLDELVPQLAMLINFKGDWSQLSLYPVPLENLSNKPKLEGKKFLNTVYKKSTELKTLQFLVKAANSAKNTRYFTFLKPGAEGLGYGYTSQIKIAKSEIKVLEINTEKTNANLQYALLKAINNYNTSLQFYKDAESQKTAMMEPALDLEKNIASSENLNLEKIDRFFEYALEADTQLNSAKHLYITSLSQLGRLLWKGGYYEKIEQHLPLNNKPKVFSSKWRENIKLGSRNKNSKKVKTN